MSSAEGEGDFPEPVDRSERDSTPYRPPAPSADADSHHEEDVPPRNWSIVIVGAVVLAVLAFAIWYFLAPRTGFVSGIVTLDNAPLPGATLVFLREDAPAGPLLATTKADGSYNLHGPSSDGVPMGIYKVAINKLVRKDRKVVSALKDGAAAPEPDVTMVELIDVVPNDYNEVGRTPLRAIVGRGNNDIRFDMKKTPQ